MLTPLEKNALAARNIKKFARFVSTLSKGARDEYLTILIHEIGRGAGTPDEAEQVRRIRDHFELRDLRALTH